MIINISTPDSLIGILRLAVKTAREILVMKYLESQVKDDSLSLSCWLRRGSRNSVRVVRVVRPSLVMSSLLNNVICQLGDDLWDTVGHGKLTCDTLLCLHEGVMSGLLRADIHLDI